MARFKYLGEVLDLGPGNSFGPCLKIRLRLQDGSVQEILPVDPETEFVVDEDIGYEITDDRCLRHLRNDARFEELP